MTPLPDRRGFDTITAAIELCRRGIPMLRAKRVVEQLLVENEA